MKTIIQLSPLQVKALAIGFAQAEVGGSWHTLPPPEDIAVLIVGPDEKSGIAINFDGTLDAEFDD